MSVFSTLLFFVPSVAFRRSAAGRLAASFSPDTAAQVWRRTRVFQTELRSTRPRHSLGVNLILRYLEWDCALYRAAQEQGLSKEQAGRLVEEINWGVFGPVTATSFKASRLRSSKLRTRIRWILDVMFLVLFTYPFQRRVLPSGDGVAFDIVACPLAAYFRKQSVPELTRYAVCSLDYRMAREWGIGLNRLQTIAEGAPLCDFRFKTIPLTYAKTGAQPQVPPDGPTSAASPLRQSCR